MPETNAAMPVRVVEESPAYCVLSARLRKAGGLKAGNSGESIWSAGQPVSPG